MVIAAFPEARLGEQIAREQAAEARQVAIDAKTSGKHVMALVPGQEGKALGEVIRGRRVAEADFEAWVLATPQREIDARIRETWTK